MSARAPWTSLITWRAPSPLPVTTTPATRLQATGRPPSSVSDSIASMRSSTRWATEDGRPGQVDDPYDVDVEAVLRQMPGDDPGQRVGVRGLR